VKIGGGKPLIADFRQLLRGNILPSDAWMGEIARICGQLEALTRSAEEEFLALGTKLQDFHGRAREVSKTSLDVANELSGAEMDTVIAELRDVFNRIGELENRSRQGSTLLENIFEQFEKMREPLEGFGKIVKILNVICVMMRIENARFGEMQTGFLTVSEDVRKLAQHILAKAQELTERSSVLSAMIRENLGLLREFESSRSAAARRLTDDTARSLDVMVDKHRASSKALGNISERYGQVSRNISEIVASMQFHDITRQRLEHVREALDDLVGLVRQAAADSSSRLPFGKLQDRTGRLASAERVCRLQGAQADHAGRELISAVERIIDNLRGVADSAGAIAGQTAAIAGQSGDAGDSFLSGLERGVSSLADSLTDYGKIDEKMSTVMRHVASATKDMSAFIGEIERIGINMRIVALNAQVNSTHIGEDGLSLGVLAGDVQLLAYDTTRKIEGISSGLALVVSMARDLGTGDGWNGVQSVDGVAAILKKATGGLHDMQEKTSGMLAGLRETGRTLQEDIGSAVGAIGVHERTKKVIDQAGADLDALRAGMREHIPEEDLKAADADLQNLEMRYTMDQERKVHETALSAGATAAVIPFPVKREKVSAAEDTAEATVAQSDELGDNVELF
jgi:methyl-accepting chemotaxis protein/molybdopterin converting factor small subunit